MTKRTITVEWESDSVGMPAAAFFEAFKSLTVIVPGVPENLTVSYDGFTRRRLGGAWEEARDAEVDVKPEPGTRLYDKALEVTSRQSLLDLLILGRSLGLISSDELKTVNRRDIVDLLFSRANSRQNRSARGARARPGRTVSPASVEFEVVVPDDVSLGRFRAPVVPRAGERFVLMGHPDVCRGEDDKFVGMVTDVLWMMRRDLSNDDYRAYDVEAVVLVSEEYQAPTLYCRCTPEHLAAVRARRGTEEKPDREKDGKCPFCNRSSR